MEFVARVAALIPPPRHPLVRYHGVLAPDSPWRAMVVPGPRRPHHRDQAPRESVIAQAMVAAGAGQTATLPRRDGATLRQRVWGVDALACTRRGGRMRWIAVIRDRAVIVRILEHIGEASALQHLRRLRLTHVQGRLDALLSEAARREWSFLDFLDRVLQEEVTAKQAKRIAMGLQIAHFPSVKTLDAFDFKCQPSLDARLVRELATGRFIANGENVRVFGPPGVGKTHLAIALGRAAVEQGHSVLFTTATALLAALAKAENEGQLAERVAFFSKPKLLVVDELGYLPFEKRSAHLFFQLVARRYERGSMLLTTNQMVSQWGSVFGDDVMAAAILDRLLHHSHTLMIHGESYRLRQKKKSGLLGSAAHPSTRAQEGGQD